MGTTRQNRASEGVADWALSALPETKNLTFERVDLRDWQLPFFDEPAPPLASQGTYTNEVGAAWLEKVKAADGYILITAEYNHSVPAVLKNALDYWYSAWTKNKPVSFISYGAAAGGVRAVEHLRQISSELKLMPLHAEVNIPLIWEAFAQDGSIKNPQHTKQLASLAAELDEWFS